EGIGRKPGRRRRSVAGRRLKIEINAVFNWVRWHQQIKFEICNLYFSIFNSLAARDSAATDQPVAGIEMNWSFPCGSPLSKKTCTGLARVVTCHEPSSSCVLSR